jgi:Flp pilus assembly protein TadG
MLNRLESLARLAGRLAVDRRGVAAIFTGFGLVVLLGFAGLGIDVAKWLNSSRAVQSAADQGAYSAASAAGTEGCLAAATTQGTAVVAARGYVDSQNGATVSVTCNPTNLTYTVQVSEIQPMWFTRLFLSGAPTATGTATAQLAGVASDLCILALDGTNFYEGVVGSDASAFWLNGNTTVDIKCGVAVDSSNVAALSTGGSSSLIATSIYIVGDKQGSPSGSSVLATSPTANNILINQRPVADPYAGRAIPSHTCGSYSMTNHTSGPLTQSHSSAGASPHTFCGGLSIGASTGSPTTVTIESGYYIIAGGSLNFNDKAQVNATNVTFILTGDSTHGYATITVNGGPQSALNLIAPTSGPYGGMAFFQDRKAPAPATNGGTTSCGGGNSQNQLNGGSSQLITGAVYFPSQSVCWGGGSSTSGAGKCTQLIAHSLSFTGNSTILADCAGTGIASINVSKPQLVQ